MHQANREAVFAWLDACNRKPKAELLQTFVSIAIVSIAIFGNTIFSRYPIRRTVLPPSLTRTESHR